MNNDLISRTELMDALRGISFEGMELEGMLQVFRCQGLVAAAPAVRIATICADVRPCLIGSEKALWHKWVDKSEIVPPSMLRGGHGGGMVADTFALIEYEGGSVQLVRATDVIFLDGCQKFQGYDFTVPPKEDDNAQIQR